MKNRVELNYENVKLAIDMIELAKKYLDGALSAKEQQALADSKSIFRQIQDSILDDMDDDYCSCPECSSPNNQK